MIVGNEILSKNNSKKNNINYKCQPCRWKTSDFCQIKYLGKAFGTNTHLLRPHNNTWNFRIVCYCLCFKFKSLWPVCFTDFLMRWSTPTHPLARTHAHPHWHGAHIRTLPTTFPRVTVDSSRPLSLSTFDIFRCNRFKASPRFDIYNFSPAAAISTADHWLCWNGREEETWFVLAFGYVCAALFFSFFFFFSCLFLNPTEQHTVGNYVSHITRLLSGTKVQYNA